MPEKAKSTPPEDATPTKDTANPELQDKFDAAKKELEKHGNVIELLQAGNREISKSLEQWDSKQKTSNQEPLQELCGIVTVQSMLLDRLFFPACDKELSDKSPLFEAQARQDLINLLVQALQPPPRETAACSALVEVLREVVQQQTKALEAKDGLFAKAKDADVATDELLTQMREAKAELQQRKQHLPDLFPITFDLQQLASRQREAFMQRRQGDYDRSQGYYQDDMQDSGQSRQTRYGGSQYGGSQYGGGQYGGSQYGGSYGEGSQYGGSQYGNGGRYGGSQYGNGGQYGGSQYGNGGQYGGSQYGNGGNQYGSQSSSRGGYSQGGYAPPQGYGQGYGESDYSSRFGNESQYGSNYRNDNWSRGPEEEYSNYDNSGMSGNWQRDNRSWYERGARQMGRYQGSSNEYEPDQYGASSGSGGFGGFQSTGSQDWRRQDNDNNNYGYRSQSQSMDDGSNYGNERYGASGRGWHGESQRDWNERQNYSQQGGYGSEIGSRRGRNRNEGGSMGRGYRGQESQWGERGRW